jgi:hypothetical protein
VVRSPSVVVFVALAPILLAFACNGLLGNTQGYLVDGGASGGAGAAEAGPGEAPETSDAAPSDAAPSDAAPSDAEAGPGEAPDASDTARSDAASAADTLSDDEGEAASAADAPSDDEGEAASATDALSDDEGDAAASPLDPSSFGITLVLWLQGDVGVSTTACEAGPCVTGWADQSSWGNNASLPDGGTPPGVTTLRGHQAVSFDDPDGGAVMWLRIPDSSSLRLHAFTIVAVASDRTPTPSLHFGDVFSKTVVNVAPFRGPALMLNCSNVAISPPTGQTCVQVDIDQYAATTELGLFDGVPRAYVAVYNVTGTKTLSLGMNDGAWVTTAVPDAGDITSVGEPAHVGGSGARANMSGDLLELIVLDVALSPAQWGSVYGYLRAKYALP